MAATEPGWRRVSPQRTLAGQLAVKLTFGQLQCREQFWLLLAQQPAQMGAVLPGTLGLSGSGHGCHACSWDRRGLPGQAAAASAVGACARAWAGGTMARPPGSNAPTPVRLGIEAGAGTYLLLGSIPTIADRSGAVYLADAQPPYRLAGITQVAPVPRQDGRWPG